MTMTRGGGWFPASWDGRVRALAAGRVTPAVPRRAATVLLLRDTPDTGPDTGLDASPVASPDTGPDTGPATAPDGGRDAGAHGVRVGGPEVYLLRRRASMAFAAGAHAYPGGGVDPRDERPTGWAGPAPEEWARRLGLDGPAAARAVVCAAVRETFEESGVLLAGPDGGQVVADTTGDGWEADRLALVAKETAFADLLERRRLVLRSDLLAPWARWRTPEFEERRYDTWFFVAVLPAGQRARDVGGEADRALWVRPAAAAAGYDAGELAMMPPTIATLRSLTRYRRAADALAAGAARDLAPVCAGIDVTAEWITVRWPGYPEFTRRIAVAGDPPDGPGGPVRPEPPAGPGRPDSVRAEGREGGR